jgi:hypothetical protein
MMQATMSRQDAIGNPEFHGVRNAYLPGPDAVRLTGVQQNIMTVKLCCPCWILDDEDRALFLHAELRQLGRLELFFKFDNN